MPSSNKRRSLSAQLAIQLAAAFAISFAVFAILYLTVSRGIDSYLDRTDYIAEKNAFYIERLQDYVTENEVSSTDIAMLENWVRMQGIVGFEIYDGNTWMYTTSSPREGEFTEKDMTGAIELKVNFSDGAFNILIYGNYTYKFYRYALIGELLFCFFVFMMIMMFGIRRMISYVQTLKDEIEILEGGNLEHSISVKWNNELTDLACSIEALRKAVLEQFEREEELKKLNNRIIADMSHDIRTPLTTIMIYQDAIKYKKYKDEKQLALYVNRIGDKLGQIKHLTDTIFRYSLETSENGYGVQIEEPFRDIMYDVISEIVECLDQRGFEVRCELDWPEAVIRAYREDIDRIVNNILSNMLKYADDSRPIDISVFSEDDYACVSFRNGILKGAEQEGMLPGIESEKKIGINNINNMMRKSGGHCRVETGNEEFAISLMFKKI